MHVYTTPKFKWPGGLRADFERQAQSQAPVFDFINISTNLNTLFQPLDVSRVLGRLQLHCKTWGVDKSCLELEMHLRACVGKTPLLVFSVLSAVKWGRGNARHPERFARACNSR